MATGTHKLVIVESPTKGRTIAKVLGKDYVVKASMGHVRDLPAKADQVPAALRKEKWANLGVNVEADFEPIYVISPEKKKVITELKQAMKGASAVYVATDEDREGEAIGWHLLEVLKPKVPVHRMVFHEITPAAIKRAVETPRDLNMSLVHAQETRRILDRLVGYTVSPVLWKMVKPQLSAGRVQSVAVRLLVLRERERMAFVSGSWWDLRASLDHKATQFNAQLTHLDSERIATGRDFDEKTGQLKEGSNAKLLDAATAERLQRDFEGAELSVTSIERRENTRYPAPPFTTSTLQQEANRKLGMGAKETMRTAQALYERGLITYMRTDSVNLSSQAVNAARERVDALYGKEYLSAKPRSYANKSKGAQEAHEAIRPAGDKMLPLSDLSLSGREAKLYDLIWKRTVATQMAEAKIATTTAILDGVSKSGDKASFKTSGREVIFPGFFRAYVEGSDDPDAKLEDRNQLLPKLSEGEKLIPTDYEARGHQTKPPARYTEASLVKALEKEGIGRPSTYASIIDTIQNRGYVMERSRQLIPTFTAMAVTQLLEELLGNIVDTEFTAEMENKLDQVASAQDAIDYLRSFYGDEITDRLKNKDNIDPKEICTIRSARIEPHLIRVGRYGPYVEFNNDEGKRQTVSLSDDAIPDEFDSESLGKLITQALTADEPLTTDPETGKEIYLLTGRYGPYLQLGEQEEGSKVKPKRASLPKHISPETITAEQAIQLINLPRFVGAHPDDGEPVVSAFGRYGPYVLHNGVYANLKSAEDDVFTISLERALQLFAEKGKSKRRGAEPMRTLGKHPEDGADIAIFDGRYGPYVKHGKINATLPKGSTVEALTLEEALSLISAKAEKAAAKKPRARKTTKKSGSK